MVIKIKSCDLWPETICLSWFSGSKVKYQYLHLDGKGLLCTRIVTVKILYEVTKDENGTEYDEFQETRWDWEEKSHEIRGLDGTTVYQGSGLDDYNFYGQWEQRDYPHKYIKIDYNDMTNECMHVDLLK